MTATLHVMQGNARAAKLENVDKERVRRLPGGSETNGNTERRKSVMMRAYKPCEVVYTARVEAGRAGAFENGVAEAEALMGNRQAILEVIRRAYDARGRGDLDGLMEAFHPEAVFTLVGDKKALEVTGSVRGYDGVREALRDFIATVDFVERQILSEVVEGDRAAVHSCLVVRYGPTRETWTADVLDLLTFKDGKIIELIEFADTAQIRDMISRGRTRS